jgi:hypothetical protein
MAEKTVGLLFITRRRLSYANDAEDPETLTAVIYWDFSTIVLLSSSIGGIIHNAI